MHGDISKQPIKFVVLHFSLHNVLHHFLGGALKYLYLGLVHYKLHNECFWN